MADNRPEWAIRAEQIKNERKAAEQAARAGASEREGFCVYLVAAALCAVAAILIYANQAQIYARGEVGAWTFVIMLPACVIAALFFVLCYRNTTMGARLLDLTVKEERRPPVEHLGFGFETESASDEKRLNSARRQARAARKAAARNTPPRSAKQSGEDADEGLA